MKEKEKTEVEKNDEMKWRGGREERKRTKGEESKGEDESRRERGGERKQGLKEEKEERERGSEMYN